jgi:hypothetical protein
MSTSGGSGGGGKESIGGKDSKSEPHSLFKANTLNKGSDAEGSDFFDLPKGRPVKETKKKIIVHAQPLGP